MVLPSKYIYSDTKLAQLCDLVFLHIEDLYHDSGYMETTYRGLFMALTLKGYNNIYLKRIVKARLFLGEFKPTHVPVLNPLPRGFQWDLYLEFIEKLKSHSLPSDFTIENMSDAEHFFTAALIAGVKIAGPLIAETGIVAWDVIIPEIKDFVKLIGVLTPWYTYDEFHSSVNSNYNQFTKADQAGVLYGIGLLQLGYFTD